MKKIFTFLLASFLITTFYTPNVINAAEDSGMQIEYEGEESTYIQDFNIMKIQMNLKKSIHTIGKYQVKHFLLKSKQNQHTLVQM